MMTKPPVKIDWRLELHEPAVRRALAELTAQRVVERIWAKDASLWSAEKTVQAQITSSLGWLDVLEWVEPQISGLHAFAAEIRAAGFEYVVLLGMGGSSLAGEVLNRTFPPPAGWPKFFMLDSTVPAAIRALEATLKLEKTLFIVASKSGSTIEVAAFHAYFFDQVQKLKGEKAGEQFIAITDPGSPLAAKAAAQNFRRIFLNRADIGGRYSALSLFGLVPAALMDIDLEKFIAPAKAMAAACRDPDPEKNPGLRLGAAMGALALAGCDKLTLFFPPEWKSLGLWIEQLVAESTGKDGKGIVPVVDEPDEAEHRYDRDRFILFSRFPGAKNDYLSVNQLMIPAVLPGVTIQYENEVHLGAAIFLWEFATAVAGAGLNVNPFDQPNVQESKDKTRELLGYYQTHGEFPEVAGRIVTINSSTVTSEFGSDIPLDVLDYMRKWFHQSVDRGQLAITAYLEPCEDTNKRISNIRFYLLEYKCRTTTTFGYGPRYLHSTGQLHKGGPEEISVIQIVAASHEKISIPGWGYGFDVLLRAQSLGDLLALGNHSRMVLRIELTDPVVASLGALQQTAGVDFLLLQPGRPKS
jgi:glucose-6-phosphate isomerase